MVEKFPFTVVGFHSAYKEDGSVAGGGNAIVGAYLARLGFKYETIYYLTQTAPKEMEWLDSDKVKKYGISVTVLVPGLLHSLSFAQGRMPLPIAIRRSSA
jgi:hypothetical protein